MTDKDMVERTVLKREMLQLELGLCLFHTLRTFKREVSTSKLGISQQEVETSSIILQDLAYSRSPLVYAQLHEKLSSSYPPIQLWSTSTKFGIQSDMNGYSA